MCGGRCSVKETEEDKEETFRIFSMKNRRNVVLLDRMIIWLDSAGYIERKG